jgi:hypothetical protein
VAGKDYPGCAFTRSQGDNISEEIGVTGEPEMLTTQLTLNDEFLVIASDGIFEFLTNQAVIDMCATSESPLEACEKIVKQAYQQWLVYESRTDDITIIVCFLQNFRIPPTDGAKGTTEDLIKVPSSVYGKELCRVGSSQSGEIPGGILKKEHINGGFCTQPPEVTLTASPAPPMALADFDTDQVEVKIEKLMGEANIGAESAHGAMSTTVTFKKDSATGSDSPESDDTAPISASRNTIRV